MNGTKKDILMEKLEIFLKVKDTFLDTLIKMKELELLAKEPREP